MIPVIDLNAAVHFLYATNLPYIQYIQHIDTRNISKDLAYSNYIEYHPTHETMHIRFPPQCVRVSDIRNYHSYKMVYYRTVGDAIEEVVIKPQTVIDVHPNTYITVYTRSNQRTTISMKLTLEKPVSNEKPMSKL